MKIALIGYGKMGRMIEQTACGNGHTIAVVVDPLAEGPAVLSGLEIQKNIESVTHFSATHLSATHLSAKELDGVDVAIEFTGPSTAAANIIALAERKIPVVSGSTGWYARMDEVKRAVDAAGSSLLWSSNFSIGVNIFYRIAWYAAELADKFPEYDVGGLEIHHNKKLDSPSGTAKTLVEGALARIGRKQKAIWETLDRRPEPDELHFPSLRVGSAPGQHSLFFDSPADTIEITHTARNREGLAAGAVRAAEWLVSPPGRRGIFTVDEMLADILGI